MCTVMSSCSIGFNLYLQGTTGVYVGLLLFEEISFVLILTGLFTNVIYLFMLNTFPFIELSSAPFILSARKLILLTPLKCCTSEIQS